MRTITWSLKGTLLAAGLFLCFSPGSVLAGDDGAVGVIRITDAKSKGTPVVLTNGETTGPVLYLSGKPVVDQIRMKRFERQLERECQECEACQDGNCRSHHGHCGRFGYFCPTGGCGEGVPCTRHYGMDYAVNPEYFDQRDGRMYAAQGWGAPMAVPLAPNVAYTYNLGWGIPSSRLTPVSRFAPHPMYLRQQ